MASIGSWQKRHLLPAESLSSVGFGCWAWWQSPHRGCCAFQFERWGWRRGHLPESDLHRNLSPQCFLTLAPHPHHKLPKNRLARHWCQHSPVAEMRSQAAWRGLYLKTWNCSMLLELPFGLLGSWNRFFEPASPSTHSRYSRHPWKHRSAIATTSYLSRLSSW